MTNDTYVGPIYEAVGPVKSFNGVPRFGHLDDISQLILYTDDEDLFRENLISYALGTIFTASFLLVSYIVFLILTSVFKCFCGKMMPILAGKPFVQERKYKGSVTSIVIRVFLFFAAIAAIISGSLFVVKGTSSVRATADDIHDGLSGISTISGKINSTATSFIKLGEESAVLRDSIVNIVEGGICEIPAAIPQNQILTDALDQIDSAADAVVEILTTLSDFATNDVNTIRDAFTSEVDDAITQMKDGTDQAVEYYRITNFYAIPAIFFGCMTLAGIILAVLHMEIKPFICFQTWVVLPLLNIFIFVTVIVIAVIGLALVANADICIGNPDGNPEGFVKVVSDEFFDDTPARALIDYYVVDGCRGEYGLLTEVNNILNNTAEAIDRSDELKDVLDGIDDNILSVCEQGVGPVNELKSLLISTIDIFSSLVDVGVDATNLLSCEDIHKVWVDVVHDGLCTSTPIALSWNFSTMTALYIFGIFTFLFRGALLPAEIEESYSEMPLHAVNSEEEYNGNDESGLLPAQTGYGNNTPP